MGRDATRRRVLAAGAVTLPLVAAGCKGLAALGNPPKAAPGVAVVNDAIVVEARLIERYGTVLAAVPALAVTLRPLLAQHHDHLARLRARLIIPPGQRAAPSPSPGRPARRGSPVPGTPAAALGYLRDAEDAAAAAQLAHLAAAPPSLAQLLASISASEAAHALILGGHEAPVTGRRSPPARAPGQADVAALQAALAAEDSAVYGYGVAGAHLTGARRAAAVRDWVAHQNARDSLTAMLAARGAQPVPAAVSYELPFAVHTAAAAVSLATVLEDRLCSAYLGLVGLSDAALRAFGARGVRAAALRAAAWRGSTLAFPGLDVPAPRQPGPATTGNGVTAPASPAPGSPTPAHPGG